MALNETPSGVSFAYGDPRRMSTAGTGPAPSASVAPAPLSADDAASPPRPAAIVVEGVTMQFDEIVAVDSLDLQVAAGTILGVIGPSGSGKTTTIRLLTGALAPTEGTIRVLGEDPRRFRRQTRRQIGYMPQQFMLYRDLTARENVDFVGSLFGMLWWSRRRRTRQALEVVDLWTVRGRRASQLSGGMQRRLELACALVHGPSLLFLDEPTAGIDPILRTRVWDELHRLRDAGRTLLIATQYVGEAEACDMVAVISDGALIALAPPDDLRRRAFGGDMVEIETATPFDGAGLADLPEVHGVRWLGGRQWRLTVDDVGAAIPAIVDALTERGIDVTSSREVRPTFDEVFALLVDAHRGSAAETGKAVAPPEGGPSEPTEAVASQDDR